MYNIELSGKHLSVNAYIQDTNKVCLFPFVANEMRKLLQKSESRFTFDIAACIAGVFQAYYESCLFLFYTDSPDLTGLLDLLMCLISKEPYQIFIIRFWVIVTLDLKSNIGRDIKHLSFFNRL